MRSVAAGKVAVRGAGGAWGSVWGWAIAGPRPSVRTAAEMGHGARGAGRWVAGGQSRPVVSRKRSARRTHDRVSWLVWTLT
jgi:hypothetical protein